MNEIEFLKDLGNHLRSMRKLKKISLRELELRGDISRHIISEIENGKRDFRITTLKKIILALNLTEREFWQNFNTSQQNDIYHVIDNTIKTIVTLLPSHNNTIAFRSLLQDLVDQLSDKNLSKNFIKFLLTQRMELHDCLNQEGLSYEQEKLFLTIKKNSLSRLEEQLGSLYK